MIKYYAILDQLNKIHVIGSSKQPKGSYEVPLDSITGEPEDAAWLQIESVQNPDTLLFEDKVTVNTVLKNQIIAQRGMDKQASDDLLAAKKLEFQTLLTEGLAFQDSQINDIQNVRNAIRKIIKFLNLYMELK